MRRTLQTVLLAMVLGAVAAPVSAELVAHWPLDADGNDVVGGHDGTVPDRVAFIAGGANANTGGAAEFDFGEGGIQAEYADELNPDDDFSVTAWVNPVDTSSWNSVVTSREDNADSVNGYIIYNSPENQWDFWTGGGGESGSWPRNIGSDAFLDEWTHLAITYNRTDDTKILYVDGEEDAVSEGPPAANAGSSLYNRNSIRPFNIGAGADTGSTFFFEGLIDDVSVWDETLSQADIQAIAAQGVSGFTGGGVTKLQPGDADQDLDFDQLDLVQVQIAAKYLTGQAATWGEGDWDGGPGGSQGSPPAGNGLFDQIDIIAALNANVYLMGPYAAIADGGATGDGQTSIVYNPSTGEVSVDAPAGVS